MLKIEVIYTGKSIYAESRNRCGNHREQSDDSYKDYQAFTLMMGDIFGHHTLNSFTQKTRHTLPSLVIFRIYKTVYL